MEVITFKDKYLDILGRNSPDEAVCLISWSALCLFPPLRKTMSPYLKNYYEFSCMFEIANELPTRYLLYLAALKNCNVFEMELKLTSSC